MLWNEVIIARDRVNGLASTNAILLQSAVASLLSKEAGKQFQKIIQDLTNGE